MRQKLSGMKNKAEKRTSDHIDQNTHVRPSGKRNVRRTRIDPFSM